VIIPNTHLVLNISKSIGKIGKKMKLARKIKYVKKYNKKYLFVN